MAIKTVSDLIKELSSFNQNASVRVLFKQGVLDEINEVINIGGRITILPNLNKIINQGD